MKPAAQIAAGGGPDDTLLGAGAEGSDSDSDSSEDESDRDGDGQCALAPGMRAQADRKADGGPSMGTHSHGQQTSGSAGDKLQRGKRQKPRRIQEL